MVSDEYKIVKSYFQIDTKEIAFFKFIIESYDGIAMFRTLNARRGEIEVMVPKCNEAELVNILHDMKRNIAIRQIKKPVDYLELVV
ncbi:DUF4911 domain-containing protein [Thermodesulfobacteriota bacterium]